MLDPSRHFRVDMVAMVDRLDKMDMVDIVVFVDMVDRVDMDLMGPWYIWLLMRSQTWRIRGMRWTMWT